MDIQPKRAPKKAPQVTVRVRTKREYELIRRAARICNVSVNTFAVNALVEAAESACRVKAANPEFETIPAVDVAQ